MARWAMAPQSWAGTGATPYRFTWNCLECSAMLMWLGLCARRGILSHHATASPYRRQRVSEPSGQRCRSHAPAIRHRLVGSRHIEPRHRGPPSNQKRRSKLANLYLNHFLVFLPDCLRRRRRSQKIGLQGIAYQIDRRSMEWRCHCLYCIS